MSMNTDNNIKMQSLNSLISQSISPILKLLAIYSTYTLYIIENHARAHKGVSHERE